MVLLFHCGGSHSKQLQGEVPLEDPVPTWKTNLVKGSRAVLRAWACHCSQQSSWACSPGFSSGMVMETIPSFWHTDFAETSSRINQNTNAPWSSQGLCLVVAFHSHTDFRSWAECLSLVSLPGIFWLTDFSAATFLCHAHYYMYIYHYIYGNNDVEILSREALAQRRLFAGKQLAALHASSHHISTVAGGFS